MTQTHTPWRDSLLTALAPAIWGTTYIVTTELLPPDRPFIAATLRTLPAGLLLVMLSRHLPRSWWRLCVLSALNIGGFQALLFVAAYRLPGGLAAVVGALQPLLVMLLVWLVDARQPPRAAVVASFAGVVGMAALLLSPNSAWDSIGILAALGGAVSMAIGSYLARRWQAAMPVLAFTGWQLLVGGGMLLPLALWLDPPLAALTLPQVGGYVYLCVFGAVLSYALWFRGLARLPTAEVASLGLLSPLTAVTLGWLWLDQAMRGQSLLGIVLVLDSILVVQVSMSQPQRAPKRAPLPQTT